MKIYHNPRCRKSRETLAILENAGKSPEIVLYLETPPTAKELKSILKKLGMRPEQIIRKGEQVFKDNFKGQSHTDAEWIQILAEHPKLIERPIVVQGDRAVLGRPPENVRELL